ncbi:hypothetical protein DL769_003996 [Monosporascus sp. CRB-8-3]|nr:hypothetical protein DL769_003996 [Monosporascus sp. CRB-8-3]
MSISTRTVAAREKAQGALTWRIIPNIWDPKSNPDGFVSLGAAENSLMHDEPNQHVRDNFSPSNVASTYVDGMTGTKRLKAAMAQFLNRHLQPFQPLEPSHIEVTNGCSSAIEHLVWGLSNPGEGFLLGQPYYGTFTPDIQSSLRRSTPTSAIPRHGSPSHPHNPLGRCYTRDAIIGPMRLCEKYGIHFISDEIYALSVWNNTVDEGEPVAFESALSIKPTVIINPSRVHATYGMSKDFGAN